MDSTNILKKEHERILVVVDALEKECGSLESGKTINEDFFRESIDFIRNYADKFHHAKEEDILFKEFCKSAEEGEVHCNPVDQMLQEHDVGRNFVKGIEEGLNERDNEKVIKNSRGYIQLIREHIFKEDDILYPMADEVLSKGVQEEMLKKFKNIGDKRKKEIGKYLDLVEGLEGGK
jgi:hemerythrin-like domain-containing protein